MNIIFIASLTIIGALSQNFDCSYGFFDENQDNNGTCMFNCQYDNNYVEISTLSFDFIKNECHQVGVAAALYPNDCKSLNDLVYSEHHCTCPYCQCSTQNLDGGINTVLSYATYGPRQSCYNCTCSTTSNANTNYGIEENVYYCDRLYTVIDSLDWNNYQCPPDTCMEINYDVSVNERYAGEKWWDDVADSDTNCTEFCYCSAKDGKICATGYDNILANDVLADQFHHDCGNYDWEEAVACWDMESQSFDTSRLFTTDTGPSCGSNCPKCDCDGRVVNDTWYIEWQDAYDVTTNEVRCSICTCLSDGAGNNYASCDYIGEEYPINSQACPAAEEEQEEKYKCHYQESTSATVGTLSARNCTAANYGEFGSQYQYCMWSYLEDDFVDSDSEDPYEWNCGNGAYCEAFANDGNCIYVEAEVEESDCYGNNKTLSKKEYIKCCNSGENCNNENIDTSSCTRSTEYEDLYKEYYKCLAIAGYDNAHGRLTCDDYVDSITCDDLLIIYRKNAECECILYGGVYTRVSNATKAILEEEIKGNYARYSQWNDALGCDIKLYCDLAAGGEIVDISTTTTTTDEPTTTSPTKDTNGPTRLMPTTAYPTRTHPTTDDPTTAAPTTIAITIMTTTAEPTTDSPATDESTTTSPTKDTDNPTALTPTTTIQPATVTTKDTDKPTTAEPTTDNPITARSTKSQTEDPTEEPTMQPTIQPTSEPDTTTTYMYSNVNETAKVDSPNASYQIVCVFPVSIVLLTLFRLY